MFLWRKSVDRFYDAIYCGKITKAQKLIKKLDKITITNFYMTCILNNKIFYVQNLIHCGLDIHFLDEFGFRKSVKNGNVEMMNLFLDLGVDVNHNDGSQLCVALENEKYEIVEILIERGININAWRNFPIKFCVKNNLIKLAELLFSKGASFYKDDIMPTFFYLAQKGNIEMMRFMIEKYDVDPTFDYYRVLDHACIYGQINVIEQLYNKDAEKYIKRFLPHAIKNGHLKIIEYFDLLDYDSRDMLKLAIISKNEKIISYFINRYKINKINDKYFTLAINTCDISVVKFLYPFLNIKSNDFLIQTIINKSIDIFNFLIEKGFNLKKAMINMCERKIIIPNEIINKHLIKRTIKNLDNYYTGKQEQIQHGEYYLLCFKNHITKLSYKNKYNICEFCDCELKNDVYVNL